MRTRSAAWQFRKSLFETPLASATRAFLIASLVGASLMMAPGPALACSCVRPGTPSEELAKSAVVFAGKALSVREYERKGDIVSGMDPTTVEFEVSRIWKGDSYQTVYLATARSGASCGFTFVEGEDYLVYSVNGTQVSLCSRTRELSRAAEDLSVLGEGSSPPAGTIGPIPIVPDLSEIVLPVRPEEPARQAPGPSDSNGRGAGCSLGSQVADVSIVGLMAGVAWLGLRRRRF